MDATISIVSSKDLSAIAELLQKDFQSETWTALFLEAKTNEILRKKGCHLIASSCPQCGEEKVISFSADGSEDFQVEQQLCLSCGFKDAEPLD